MQIIFFMYVQCLWPRTSFPLVKHKNYFKVSSWLKKNKVMLTYVHMGVVPMYGDIR